MLFYALGLEPTSLAVSYSSRKGVLDPPQRSKLNAQRFLGIGLKIDFLWLTLTPIESGA